MNTRIRTALALVAALAMVLLAAGCRVSSPAGGDQARDPEPAKGISDQQAAPPMASVEPNESTGTRPVENTILDVLFLRDMVESRPVRDGAVLVAVMDPETTEHASAGFDDDGFDPALTNTFRVGSVTKALTALLVMSLVDDGMVDLDTPAIEYVSRVQIPADITVRQLLQHRSGIYNYTDRRGFFAEVMADPARVWTPEDIMAPIRNEPTLFAPDARFSYSNTNYLVLGVLVEEVTKQAYHSALRDRILDPLDMSSTYLSGFESGPDPFDPFASADGSPVDYTSIATSAWAAGALVSSAADMHTLFTAVFRNQVVSAESVSMMTVGDGYGLGLILTDWRDGVVGHNGSIPGYTSLVLHAPETGVTVFGVTTESAPRPGLDLALTNALIDYVS